MKLMLNPLIVYGVGLCETSIRHPNLYTFSNELQSCNDFPHQQILNSYIYIFKLLVQKKNWIVYTSPKTIGNCLRTLIHSTP